MGCVVLLLKGGHLWFNISHTSLSYILDQNIQQASLYNNTTIFCELKTNAVIIIIVTYRIPFTTYLYEANVHQIIFVVVLNYVKQCIDYGMIHDRQPILNQCLFILIIECEIIIIIISNIIHV